MTSFQPEETPSFPTERENILFLKFPFPWKLQQLLEDAENDGNQDIISWLPCGKAFKIHNKIKFTAQIMPLYFRQTKYKSFTRQLYMYGFRGILTGEYRGGFSHPDFVRGNKMAVLSIVPRNKYCPNSIKPSWQQPNNITTEDVSSYSFDSSGPKSSLSCPIQVLNDTRMTNSSQCLPQTTEVLVNKKNPTTLTIDRASKSSNIDESFTDWSGGDCTTSSTTTKSNDWLHVLLSTMTYSSSIDNHDDGGGGGDADLLLEPRPIEDMIASKR